MATLGNVTDVLSSLTILGEEPLIMSVPRMSMVLQKMRSDIVGEHTVGNGQVSVHLPNLTEVFSGISASGYVDLQVSIMIFILLTSIV